MQNEIFDVAQKKNLTQARRIINHFRQLGFTGMGEPGTAFAITCLNAFYNKEHNDNELIAIVTDGDDDDSIDAIHFHGADVDIFDFKVKDTVSATELEKLEGSIKRNFFSGKVRNFAGKTRLKWHLKKFHSGNAQYSNVNVFVIRGEKKFSAKENAIKLRIEGISPGIKVEFLSRSDVINKSLAIDFLPKWKLTKHNVDRLYSKKLGGISRKYHSLVLKIPIYNLMLLYKQHLDKGKDLFAINVRAPKGLKKFQADLSETINTRPDYFHYFHNGLTITATDIADDVGFYYINEPQVVNGAQTIGNLYDAYLGGLSLAALKRVAIICKVIKADESLANEICEASNTQKAIKLEDLRTNDSFQRELELYIFNASGGRFSYVRKSAAALRRGSIKIPYAKFFQWAYAALMRQPAAAKNAKKLIFENSQRGYYNDLVKRIRLSLGKMVRLCEIGVFVKNRIKAERASDKKTILRGADLHIVAALFLLPSAQDADFDHIYGLIKEYVVRAMGIDPTLNYNKIFTKSDELWKYLRGALNL